MKSHLATAVLAAAIGATGTAHFLTQDTDPHSALIAHLKAEEGFKRLPYRDTRGQLTIGYGTDLDAGISFAEGEYLLAERARANAEALYRLWKPLRDMRPDVRQALEDMAYQLGATGVLEFRKMLAALVKRDYATAAREALDSAWARETPKRAARVVKAFRDGS